MYYLTVCYCNDVFKIVLMLFSGKNLKKGKHIKGRVNILICLKKGLYDFYCFLKIKNILLTLEYQECGEFLHRTQPSERTHLQVETPL